MGQAQPCALLASDRTLEPSPVRLSGVCGRQDMAGRASTSAEGDVTGPSRLMYGTTRVSKRRLNSIADERGGARHANPRFTAVAVVGWSSSSEAHDGRFRRICGLPAYRRSPLDPGWQPWPGRRPGRGCSGSTILMNVLVPTTHRTSRDVRPSLALLVGPLALSVLYVRYPKTKYSAVRVSTK